ncbi:MAG TPA: histidine phosphatase family protein, partial [Candidatus Obscuribacter sp.]|nr:histidine phosphatase family protein [Candidatus Obscuribacter sp.]
GKKICMVTHSGIIRSALVHALEMPVRNFWRFSVPTGSITRIDFSKNFATVQFASVRPELT